MYRHAKLDVCLDDSDDSDGDDGGAGGTRTPGWASESAGPAVPPPPEKYNTAGPAAQAAAPSATGGPAAPGNNTPHEEPARAAVLPALATAERPDDGSARHAPASGRSISTTGSVMGANNNNKEETAEQQRRPLTAASTVPSSRPATRSTGTGTPGSRPASRMVAVRPPYAVRPLSGSASGGSMNCDSSDSDSDGSASSASSTPSHHFKRFARLGGASRRRKHQRHNHAARVQITDSLSRPASSARGGVVGVAGVAMAADVSRFDDAASYRGTGRVAMGATVAARAENADARDNQFIGFVRSYEALPRPEELEEDVHATLLDDDQSGQRSVPRMSDSWYNAVVHELGSPEKDEKEMVCEVVEKLAEEVEECSESEELDTGATTESEYVTGPSFPPRGQRSASGNTETASDEESIVSVGSSIARYQNADGIVGEAHFHPAVMHEAHQDLRELQDYEILETFRRQVRQQKSAALRSAALDEDDGDYDEAFDYDARRPYMIDHVKGEGVPKYRAQRAGETATEYMLYLLDHFGFDLDALAHAPVAATPDGEPLRLLRHHGDWLAGADGNDSKTARRRLSMRRAATGPTAAAAVCVEESQALRDLVAEYKQVKHEIAARRRGADAQESDGVDDSGTARGGDAPVVVAVKRWMTVILRKASSTGPQRSAHLRSASLGRAARLAEIRARYDAPSEMSLPKTEEKSGSGSIGSSNGESESMQGAETGTFRRAVKRTLSRLAVRSRPQSAAAAPLMLPVAAAPATLSAAAPVVTTAAGATTTAAAGANGSATSSMGTSFGSTLGPSSSRAVEIDSEEDDDYRNGITRDDGTEAAAESLKATAADEARESDVVGSLSLESVRDAAVAGVSLSDRPVSVSKVSLTSGSTDRNGGKESSPLLPVAALPEPKQDSTAETGSKKEKEVHGSSAEKKSRKRKKKKHGHTSDGKDKKQGTKKEEKMSSAQQKQHTKREKAANVDASDTKVPLESKHTAPKHGSVRARRSDGSVLGNRKPGSVMSGRSSRSGQDNDELEMRHVARTLSGNARLNDGKRQISVNPFNVTLLQPVKKGAERLAGREVAEEASAARVKVKRAVVGEAMSLTSSRKNIPGERGKTGKGSEEVEIVKHSRREKKATGTEASAGDSRKVHKKKRRAAEKAGDEEDKAVARDTTRAHSKDETADDAKRHSNTKTAKSSHRAAEPVKPAKAVTARRSGSLRKAAKMTVFLPRFSKSSSSSNTPPARAPAAKHAESDDYDDDSDSDFSQDDIVYSDEEEMAKFRAEVVQKLARSASARRRREEEARTQQHQRRERRSANVY